jgi:hypothetical protein
VLRDTAILTLAAAWDQQAEVSGEEKFHGGDTDKPTIH